MLTLWSVFRISSSLRCPHESAMFLSCALISFILLTTIEGAPENIYV